MFEFTLNSRPQCGHGQRKAVGYQRMSRTVYRGIVLTCRAGMGVEVDAQAAWAVEPLIARGADVLLGTVPARVLLVTRRDAVLAVAGGGGVPDGVAGNREDHRRAASVAAWLLWIVLGVTSSGPRCGAERISVRRCGCRPLARTDRRLGRGWYLDPVGGRGRRTGAIINKMNVTAVRV